VSAPNSDLGELTQASTVLGSPRYMAPEQLFGPTTIDERADVWSIGVILYQMLSGRTPYEQNTLATLCAELLQGQPPLLSTVNPEVSARLAAAVARCFEFDVNNRPEKVAELAGSLLEAMDSPAEALRERLSVIIATRAAEPISLRSTPRPLESKAAFKINQVRSPVGVTPAAATAPTAVASKAFTLSGQPPAPSKRPTYLAASIVIATTFGAFALLRASPDPRDDAPAHPMSAARETLPVAAQPSGAIQALESTITQPPAPPTGPATAGLPAGTPFVVRRRGGPLPPASATPPKPRADDDDIPRMR
jgi:serine/threonine-protein kinase